MGRVRFSVAISLDGFISGPSQVSNQLRDKLVHTFLYGEVERCFRLINEDVVDELLFVMVLK